jgi:hypothetical protein
MGNCRDCHNEVHAKEATDRILRLLIVKVPFEEVGGEISPLHSFTTKYPAQPNGDTFPHSF